MTESPKRKKAECKVRVLVRLRPATVAEQAYPVCSSVEVCTLIAGISGVLLVCGLSEQCKFVR